MTDALLVLAPFVVIVLGLQLFGRYVFVYRLTKAGVDTYLLGFVPLVLVRYEDIASIEVVTFKDVLFKVGFAWRLGTSFYAPHAVLIRRKGRLASPVVLTPADPWGFVEAVKQRAEEAVSWRNFLPKEQPPSGLP